MFMSWLHSLAPFSDAVSRLVPQPLKSGSVLCRVQSVCIVFLLVKLSFLFVNEQFVCMIFADRHSCGPVMFQPEVRSQLQSKDTLPSLDASCHSKVNCPSPTCMATKH